MASLTAGETEATERLGNLLMATQLVMALPPLLAQACLCFHPPVHQWENSQSKCCSARCNLQDWQGH